MDTCGKCGSTDIGGGSWTPDYCRKCGAIDGVSCWYYDDNRERLISDKYKQVKHLCDCPHCKKSVDVTDHNMIDIIICNSCCEGFEPDANEINLREWVVPTG